MIQCKECGFPVNEMMRFALMKNVCPSCGSGLLSGRDADVIAVIQSKLSSQRFSSSLTETQIYDISLFLFNELKHGLGDLVSEFKTSPKKVAVSDDDSTYSEADENDLKSIRESIAAEVLGDEDEEEEDDEDISSKAERLRKLHQQRLTASTTAKESQLKSIKRGGFRGVTRST